jgi:hypothetical protein
LAWTSATNITSKCRIASIELDNAILAHAANPRWIKFSEGTGSTKRVAAAVGEGAQVTAALDRHLTVGVDEWHGHNVFFRDGDKVFRTYFVNSRGDEAMGTTWSYLDITPLGRQETWEDSPEGYPQTPPYKWWNWHDNYDAEASPDPKWVEVSDAGEAAFRMRDADDPKPVKEGRER